MKIRVREQEKMIKTPTAIGLIIEEKNEPASKPSSV
jgi:hypothetical protein